LKLEHFADIVTYLEAVLENDTRLLILDTHTDIDVLKHSKHFCFVLLNFI